MHPRARGGGRCPARRTASGGGAAGPSVLGVRACRAGKPDTASGGERAAREELPELAAGPRPGGFAAKAAALACLAGSLALLGDAPAQAASGLSEAFPTFDVNFLGVEVNHKELVEALVLGQAIGFVGSLVTGNLATQRKKEVEKLNESLRQVTKELRKQTRAQRKKLKVTSPEGESVTQRKAELLGLMKDGKQALSLQKGEEAKEMFESALGKLDQAKGELESPWRAERKVFRGLGAASAQLGEHSKALDYMMKVVSLSESHQDFRGLGDAYGVIAGKSRASQLKSQQAAGQCFASSTSRSFYSPLHFFQNAQSTNHRISLLC